MKIRRWTWHHVMDAAEEAARAMTWLARFEFHPHKHLEKWFTIQETWLANLCGAQSRWMSTRTWI